MYENKRWECRNLTIPEPLQGLHVSGLVPGGTPVPPKRIKKGQSMNITKEMGELHRSLLDTTEMNKSSRKVDCQTGKILWV